MEFCKIFGNLIRFLCISMTIIYVLGFTQDFLIKIFATHKYFSSLAKRNIPNSSVVMTPTKNLFLCLKSSFVLLNFNFNMRLTFKRD